MKKKLYYSILTLILITTLVLAGCQSKAEQNQEVVDTDSNVKPVKVALLLLDPQGTPFNQLMIAGINQAKTEGYVSESKIIEMKSPSEWQDTVRASSEQGYDVVLTQFGAMLESIQNVAPDFPDTKYVVVWNAAPEDAAKYPNVRGVLYNVQEGTYLAGMLATSMSTNHHICFIGGGDNDLILRFLAGYEAGMKAVDPNGKLDVAWAGTFTDPAKGKELANSLFDRGCEVVSSAADQTGLGGLQAATEKGKYAIGDGYDQSEEAPNAVLASSVVPATHSVYAALKDIATNSFSGGTVFYGIKDGTSPLIFGKLAIPEDIMALVKQAEEDIASGKIEVPTTTTTR